MSDISDFNSEKILRNGFSREAFALAFVKWLVDRADAHKSKMVGGPDAPDINKLLTARGAVRECEAIMAQIKEWVTRSTED